MAHYAKIGLNNRVISVAPVDDNIILNADGREDDDLAISHLISTTGWPFWIKCSYNTKGGKHYSGVEESDTQEKALRKNYPGIGWTYDEDRDAFIPPKPSTSFVLNEEKCIYEPPIDLPSTGHNVVDGNNIPYVITWNEANQRWQASDTVNDAEDKYWDPDTSTWIDM